MASPFRNLSDISSIGWITRGRQVRPLAAPSSSHSNWFTREKSYSLHKAVQYRNIHKIKILSAIHDINEINENGYPAFILACEQDNDEMMEFILSIDGIDPTLTNNDEFTALHVLAFRGKLKWIKTLFEKFPKMEVDPLNDKDNTPLIMAAKMNHFKVIEYLHHRGADVNAKNKKGFTALMYAANNGYVDSTKILISLGAVVNVKDDYGLTPLIKSCGWGFIETAKILLENKASLNYRSKNGDTALYGAVKRKVYDLAELLLQKGAEVDCKFQYTCNTPLSSACRNDDLEMMKLLIKYGADINYPGNYSLSLFTCIKYKSYECAKVLLKMKVDVNGRNSQNLTPLMYAQRRRDAQMQLLLLGC